MKAKPRAGVDIVRSTNTFEGGTLTMNVRALKLAKDDYAGYWLINTADTNYVLIYSRSGGQDQVQSGDVGPDPERIGRLPRPQGVVCDTVTAKTLRKKDLVVATVPRSCLGGAGTVRVGAALLRETGTEFSVDDARRTGFPDAASQPKLGPKLRRN